MNNNLLKHKCYEKSLHSYCIAGISHLCIGNERRIHQFLCKGVTTLDDALNVPGGTLHFISEGDYPWQVMTEDDRVYAQSSNMGVHNSASKLSLPQFRLDEISVLTFDFKAWE